MAAGHSLAHSSNRPKGDSCKVQSPVRNCLADSSYLVLTLETLHRLKPLCRILAWTCRCQRCLGSQWRLFIQCDFRTLKEN
uniref:Uncharacterized protein n=1 Tax=Pyxicephalus adspersus TaxID=30357 RepID=A0AAV2ZSI0_PYXAD|nr:TPA: hypothetical protein GDO54_002450 [Pyxicephalus adspersus]